MSKLLLIATALILLFILGVIIYIQRKRISMLENLLRNYQKTMSYLEDSFQAKETGWKAESEARANFYDELDNQ